MGDLSTLILLLACAAFAQRPQTTDQQIAALSKIAAAKPGSARDETALAKAYIQKMRETVDFSYLDRASRIVDDLLARDAGNYPALRLRSEIGMERHEFKQVEEYSQAMTDFFRDDPWNWGTLGDASMELGKYDQARKAYERMAALRPDLSSYNRLSYYHFVTGDAEGAISLMKAAVSGAAAAPENKAWCLADLGKMYFKIGKLLEAAAAFHESLAVFPNYYPAYAGLGSIEGAENHTVEAIESYKRAQSSVPLPEYASALEELYQRAGKPAESKQQQQLLEAIETMARSANEKTNRNLAIIYADHDRNLDRALELAQNEIAVRPDVYTYDALAWVLFKRKQYPAAADASAKALALKTPEPLFYFHAGMIAEALDRKAEAKKYLESAMALNPKFDIRQAEVARAALERLSAAIN